MLFVSLVYIGLYYAVFHSTAAQLLPNSQALIINELEHLYFDNLGPKGFKSGIEPCTNYLDSTTGLDNNTLGRQTSAQWLRTSFHDFVTADVQLGTGGLDASIGFETLRPENVGTAFNDSLFFFSFFVTDKVSMADLIALGTAMSVGACGGPQIPLRGGRVDATGPGIPGVPEPQTDINTTLSDFSRAGFNEADAIGLTACGHTLGGVHHSRFLQIVPESAVGVNNAGGRIAFDDTVANFDVNVVQQYLDGSGHGGGPLVTTTNKTVQSDLRLYCSDHNATIKSLAQTSEQFRSTCTTLYIVTTEVDPAPSSLTIQVIGRNRRLTSYSATAITDLSNDMGNGVYGPTFQYPFSVTFPGATGLSGLQVSNQTFALTDSLFVVPALSSITPGLATYSILDPSHDFTFNITAAVLTRDPPGSLQGTIALPVPQQGTMSPRIDRSTNVRLDYIGAAGPFSLYSVLHTQSMTSLQLFGSSIDIEDGRGAETMFFKLFSILQFF